MGSFLEMVNFLSDLCMLKSQNFKCFSLGFSDVKGQHDQGNSYKGNHSIGAGLQFQRFSPLSS